MINVGVIGTGYIGPIHLEALRRVEGVRIKAVCDINRRWPSRLPGNMIFTMPSTTPRVS